VDGLKINDQNLRSYRRHQLNGDRKYVSKLTLRKMQVWNNFNQPTYRTLFVWMIPTVFVRFFKEYHNCCNVTYIVAR
jgi:hypothetical protein